VILRRLRSPESRALISMRRYIQASLRGAAIPRERWTSPLWLRAQHMWWPQAVQAGLHRMPPGLIFDLLAALTDSPLSWQLREGEDDYLSAIRQFSIRCFHRRGRPIDASALDQMLRGLSLQLASAQLPAPPEPLDLEALRCALEEHDVEAAQPPILAARSEQRGSWSGFVADFARCLASPLRAPQWESLPLQLRMDDGPNGDEEIYSIELELLEMLKPRNLEVPERPATSRAQTRGHLSDRQPNSPAAPGVDGIELTDMLERACLWQFGLGRRFVAERMAARELCAYRPPRRAGQRRTPALLIGWLDPTSILPAALQTQRDAYAAGKRLAGQLFLDILGLADELGTADLSVGLASLPTRQSLVVSSAEAARRIGWRNNTEWPTTGPELLRVFPPLARFFSRSAHRLTIAEICSDAGLLGHGLALIVSKSLVDALKGFSSSATPVSVVMLIPEQLLPILEPRGIHAELPALLRAQIDELTRSQLPSVRIAALAFYDELGTTTRVACAKQAAARIRHTAAAAPRILDSQWDGERLARQALEQVLDGTWAQKAS